MKKFIQQTLFAALLMAGASAFSQAQLIDYVATKEKIYVQTSHVFFKPGETIYFKLYVVEAKSGAPTRLSNVVYAEIINPSGNVVQKLNYRIENGYAEGSFDFATEAVGGLYKLRFYTTWMRNEESNFYVKEVTLQKVIAPRILMKLDFPEKGYGAGAEVTADFSMRNLNDQPVRDYSGKLTVSIGGVVVQTDDFKTNHLGKAKISFILPKDLNTTDGLLNITINYDAYTESISRSIPIVLNKIDLQFMPEGGTLVEGISTQIAFKALNENGKAADIKGELLDGAGNRIATISSYHFGMGRFAFTPLRGQLYKIKITSPANIVQQFTLPAAVASGVVINMQKENGRVMIKLISTDEKPVKLAGHSKNVTYYTESLALKKGENNIVIDEALFPVGIAQFTLSTINDLPLAERLYFLNEDKNLQVSITTDKPRYLPREKVTLTIKTLDENGKPMPSNFSLSVVDDKLWSFADDKQDHILSWLLLSSELRGKIEEPQFYFKREEPKAVPALDLLMLTQGYRYFDYIEYVLKEGKPMYGPDGDNILGGVIFDVNQKPVAATVFLVNTNAGGNAIRITTDEEGRFFFSQIAPNTTYYLFAQSLNKQDKVSIQVLQKGIGYRMMPGSIKSGSPTDDFSRFSPIVVPPKDKAKFELKELAFKKEWAVERRQQNLNEVVVVGYGSVLKRSITGAIASINAKDVLAVNNVGFLLQGKVAGVQVLQNANPGSTTKFMIRGTRSIAGANQPLIVLNGIPAENFNFNTINASDIESVTVFKDGAATALYGARAANGVILIESKKFRNSLIRFNFPANDFYATQLVQFSGTSYAVARRFYAPRYASTETTERTDFRETIYWNGVVQTNSKGTAVVEFYNSDASTTFRAMAEGISFNGKAGRAEATYSVRNALQVDAKIPPYLTVGDKALIPVVIKNNSDKSLTLTIAVHLPTPIKAGNYSTTIQVGADSSRQVLIPIEAVAAVKGIMQFSIEGGANKETISLPVEAVEKGFPVIETFAGNKSAQHPFNISKMIPGSLKTNLKLFTNIEGQLLDGIESMLREPYGCFEQTSSATYPNIFVLKYLKESGKSNPEIEKKALDYIERGYKRLIGYETAQSGFEWFGKTPPHEALTAYGLLEFTDMQEFINVDKGMLQRTKAFLLSRRDGAGGFSQASGGYDRFASVPNKIANIYIVYALTQAGFGKEIIPEYKAAVKKALETADGYQLCMMALAASNMKNEEDFRLLMNAANTVFQKSNLASETSVVNSRDASLRVEAMSLYALALLREQSPNMGVIASVISKIFGEKSYYGYGSTQATVLALNAIVQYSKLAGKMTENSPITFILNNDVIGGDKDATLLVTEGSNLFSVRYGDETKAIPYSLEVAYHTFTPPASDKAELRLKTTLASTHTKVGETVRLQIEVTNTKPGLQPMAIAKIGIPAGLSAQPWQLKEIMEQNGAAYYEIFDNYLVFYWMGFKGNEVKRLNLDLKAEVAGTYKGKASNVYLYYTPEYKQWADGASVEIKE